MRSKVTLVLIFLNVVLFFFIFDFERNWQTERAMMEARRRVLGAEAVNIRSLEVSNPQGGIAYRIEKRGDAWFLTSPAVWPANPNAVSRILNELQLLEHETSFSVRKLADSHETLADFGLDQPKLVVTFTSGEPGDEPGTPPPRTTVLRIGDTTRVGDHLYLLSPDGETIHVVNRSLAESLDIPQDQLRSDTVFTIPVFEARFLSIQSTAASGVRVRIRRDANRWSFETPVSARASKVATELAVNGLDDLRVKSFPGTPPATAPSADPAIRISLEGNNRHETLFVGGETGGDHEYYAQLESRPAVFTVVIPPWLLDDLSTPQDRLRDPHILEFDPRDVTAITLSTRNPPDLVLQRLDAAPGADQAPPWQIVRPDASGQTPQTLPADSAAIQAFLDRLTRLEATQFQTDNPTDSDLESWGFNSPERVVTLALGGASPVPRLMLEIGLPGHRDGAAYARVAGSASIYTVDPDILRSLPVSPLAWRDRILNTLSDTAQVTALKLTDVTGGPPLYERHLADGETWESALAQEPAARRAAVLAVRDQIRHLRADAYVQEGFPSKVFAAGEVRPWRYRLDATISLPGGEHGKATDTVTLWLAERTGGAEQLAGSEKIGAVVQIEQPLIDALWTLTYGARDPGPPPMPAPATGP